LFPRREGNGCRNRKEGEEGNLPFFTLCSLIRRKLIPSGSRNQLGIRASSTCTLNFDDIKIPAENLIGEEGKGYK